MTFDVVQPYDTEIAYLHPEYHKPMLYPLGYLPNSH